jgi:hypothetical protein
MGRYQKRSPLAPHGRRMTTAQTAVTTNAHPNPSIAHSANKSTVFGKIKTMFKNNGNMQEIDLATDLTDEVSG